MLFLHPAYQAPSILLCLPMIDHTPGDFGVHLRTALLAGQIIANNAFGGYLTSDQAGQQRVDTDPEGILTGETYYFVANTVLSMCPTFYSLL